MMRGGRGGGEERKEGRGRKGEEGRERKEGRGRKGEEQVVRERDCGLKRLERRGGLTNDKLTQH